MTHRRSQDTKRLRKLVLLPCVAGSEISAIMLYGIYVICTRGKHITTACNRQSLGVYCFLMLPNKGRPPQLEKDDSCEVRPGISIFVEDINRGAQTSLKLFSKCL